MGTDHQFGAHGRRTPSGVAIGDSLVTSATLGSSASSVRSAAKSAAEWVCACRGTWLWAGPDRQAGEQSGCAQAGEGQQGGPQPGGEVGRAQVAAGGGEDRGGGGDAEDPADVLEGGADTAGQSDLRGGDRAGTPRPWSGRSGRRRFRPATTGLAGAGSCWLVPRPPPAGQAAGVAGEPGQDQGALADPVVGPVNGSTPSPVRSGGNPCASCRYCGTGKAQPNTVANSANRVGPGQAGVGKQPQRHHRLPAAALGHPRRRRPGRRRRRTGPAPPPIPTRPPGRAAARR